MYKNYNKTCFCKSFFIENSNIEFFVLAKIFIRKFFDERTLEIRYKL